MRITQTVALLYQFIFLVGLFVCPKNDVLAILLVVAVSVFTVFNFLAYDMYKISMQLEEIHKKVNNESSK